MSKQPQVPSTDEAWDTGELGREEQFVVRAPDVDEAKIDNALDLQLISIRLQKSLIEDFKHIAALNGIGYQPLMRQILKRFADAEKKRILRERAAEMKVQIKAAKSAKGEEPDDPPAPRRKVASAQG
ncbi:MAG: hypothetical protein WD793_12190 [Steroidobacteraceae bacterium]